MKEIQDEIKDISNRKNVTNDPMEDKLALFRQQVILQKFVRKKENLSA